MYLHLFDFIKKIENQYDLLIYNFTYLLIFYFKTEVHFI